MVTHEKQIHLFYWMKRRDKKSSKTNELGKEITLQKVGTRIKNLRINKGYTSYEYFAYDHNISRAQFGRYEQGQDLRLSSLIKVLNALEITLQEFFNEGFD